MRGGGFGLELGGPDGDARGVLVLDAASMSSPSEPTHSSSVPWTGSAGAARMVGFRSPDRKGRILLMTTLRVIMEMFFVSAARASCTSSLAAWVLAPSPPRAALPAWLLLLAVFGCILGDPSLVQTVYLQRPNRSARAHTSFFFGRGSRKSHRRL